MLLALLVCTTHAKHLTYYQIDGKRYLALPYAVASKYGNITGAVAAEDFREFELDGNYSRVFNITENIHGPATKESNASTEALSIASYFGKSAKRVTNTNITYSNLTATVDNNSTTIDKRFIVGLGAVTVFFAAVGVTGVFGLALCTAITYWPGYTTNPTGTAVCVGSAIMVMTAMTFSGCIALAGYTSTALTAMSQTWSFVQLVLNGLSSTYLAPLAGYFVKAKRSGIDLETLKHAVVYGLHMNQSISLIGPAGLNYTLYHLLAANQTQPLVISGSKFGLNQTTHIWLGEHPSNSSRVIFHTKYPAQENNATWNMLRKQQKVKRQFEGSDDDGDVGEYQGGNLDYPTDPDWYMGLDFYAYNAAGIIADYFSGDSDNGGLGWFDAQAIGYTWGYQAWETCVCFQYEGQWIATGSMQASWDETYNGYSECFNADCDGA